MEGKWEQEESKAVLYYSVAGVIYLASLKFLVYVSYDISHLYTRDN